MRQRRKSLRKTWLLVAFLGVVFVVPLDLDGQQPASPAVSKYQYKIGVLPFVDNTGSGGEDTGVHMGRAVQAELAHSSDLVGRVLKLDEGTNAEDVDAEKAVEIGRARKVDVVLVGTVLEANSEESEKSASAPNVFGQQIGASARSIKALVTLQGDLYNVADGKKIDSIRVTGRASDTKASAYVSTSLGDITSGGSSFESSPIGKALHNAVAELVKKIGGDKAKMLRFNAPAEGAASGEGKEKKPSE